MREMLNRKILRFFTRAIIKKYNPEIVGIAGSVGKTSTKEMALEILRSNFRVRGSEKNICLKIGLPLAIIGVSDPGSSCLGWLRVWGRALRIIFCHQSDYPEILVLEMGAAKRGDMEYLTDLVNCDIAVVTASQPVHLDSFKTTKKMIQEERQLISSLGKTAWAILNHDEGEVISMSKKTAADILTYGFHPQASVRASDVKTKLDREGRWPEGMMFKISYEGSLVPIYIPGVIGEHVVYPALAAITVGLALGLYLVDISASLKDFKWPNGRMRLLAGIKKTLLIDDSYNASPGPMRAALRALSGILLADSQTKKYAVIGDMAELGQQTVASHREVGLRVVEAGVDYLITVGEAMKIAAQAAREAGLPEDHIYSFSLAAEAGRFLQERLKTGDVVLIKGSRIMHMEKIVKEVMAEPLILAEIASNQIDKR